MGITYKPHKVKLVVGLLANDHVILAEAVNALAGLFGDIDCESGLYDFTQSDYYENEMGPNLKRKFISFKALTGLDNIHEVKLITNKLEREMSLDGKRRVNIDPGYLDLAKLVLFSTKDYTHRIYLGKGIYAEVTLYYKDNKYNAWPWTYPDYKSDPYLSIFNSIRELYAKDDREC